MAQDKTDKTNVMRILDQKKISYAPHYYAAPDGAVDGATVASWFMASFSQECGYRSSYHYPRIRRTARSAR